jgi:hypothetical protein
MKTNAVICTAVAALLVLGLGTAALASTGSQGNNSAKPGPFTKGEVITFKGLIGHSNNLTSGADGRAGHSTGFLQVNVTEVASSGDTLTILSGNFTIGQTTYAISGGTVVLHPSDRSGNGTGTATGGATFALKVSGIHINTRTGALTAHLKYDVTVGSAEYHVLLHTTHRK